MSEDLTPQQSRRKCPECGLVNGSTDEKCRRCGAMLVDDDEDSFVPWSAEDEAAESPRRRSLAKRLVWIVSATIVVLIVWYVSLLLSSDKLQPDQNRKVDVAIGLI